MRRFISLSLVLAVSAAASLGAEKSAPVLDVETATRFNPFKPAGSAGQAAPAANETIEFAGVSQMGNTTHLIFHDKSAKKNRWIGLGETVEGITVVRYDSRLEQAVVKVNGVEKTLALRKGSGPVNSPAPVATLPAAAGFAVPTPPPQTLGATSPPPVDIVAPAAAKPPAPNTPESQAKAETEARMLVSDLLEIGIAQRKAYEEAQRRAADGKSGQPAPPAPGQPSQAAKQ